MTEHGAFERKDRTVDLDRVSTPVKNRIIMLVRAERPDRPPEILTYFSPGGWKAQLFFNTERSGASIQEKCRTSIQAVFRVPIHRAHVDESIGRSLVVHKQSQDPVDSKLGITEYRYWVQPVTIEGLPRALLNDGHVQGYDGYVYSLRTIASLKADERAMTVNGEEINFVSRTFGGNPLQLILPSTFTHE